MNLQHLSWSSNPWLRPVLKMCRGYSHVFMYSISRLAKDSCVFFLFGWKPVIPALAWTCEAWTSALVNWHEQSMYPGGQCGERRVRSIAACNERDKGTKNIELAKDGWLVSFWRFNLWTALHCFFVLFTLLVCSLFSSEKLWPRERKLLEDAVEAKNRPSKACLIFLVSNSLQRVLRLTNSFRSDFVLLIYCRLVRRSF